ncbi:MAG: NTP transferase domain-containing protein [Nocardioides sp.]|nr:NTP transferase domain-containing protein [Nocardioides sp.]
MRARPLFALVPVKGFARAKSRLDVPARQRAQVAETLACRTLTLLVESDVHETFVVSDDTDVLDLAVALGCQAVAESRPWAGLNAALSDATHAAAAADPRGATLVMVADLPALDRAVVAQATELFATATSPMFVPDRDGTGSTAAFRPPGDQRGTHFGRSSARRHLRAGYRACLEVGNALRWDLDVLADLDESMASGILAPPNTSPTAVK